MRTVKTPIFIASAFALTAGTGPSQLLPHYLVTPGPVTGDRTAGINGSFKLVQATAPNGSPDSGFPSNLAGGACIVFRVQDLAYHLAAAKSCTQDEDCATSEPSAHYCQQATGQCWARPGIPPPTHDPLCKRSIDSDAPAAWPVGKDIPISTSPIPLASYNLQANAQALVIALTKGKPPNGQRVVLNWGTATAIP